MFNAIATEKYSEIDIRMVGRIIDVPDNRLVYLLREGMITGPINYMGNKSRNHRTKWYSRRAATTE